VSRNVSDLVNESLEVIPLHLQHKREDQYCTDKKSCRCNSRETWQLERRVDAPGC
jgi:hypothetical protein